MRKKPEKKTKKILSIKNCPLTNHHFRISELYGVLPLHLESPLVEALDGEGTWDGGSTGGKLDGIALLADDLTHSERSSFGHLIRARVSLQITQTNHI